MARDEWAFESAAAIRAFDDYWNLGNGRTLDKLLTRYRAEPDPEEVPTTDARELRRWHNDYNWQMKCAEREARVSEMSEAMVAEDRATMKRERLNELRKVRTLASQILDQAAETFNRPIVEEDEDGNEIIKCALSMPDLVKLFPRAVSALIQAHKEEKQEVGEDTQRFHVTVEQVVNALPPEIRDSVRDALYEDLMRPAGQFPEDG